MAKERKKLESVKVETPFGSFESDSGNHVMDVATVVGVVLLFMLIKKMLLK